MRAAEIDAFLAAGPAALVRVEAARGSTPREAGAWMLVSTRGTLGTIGGGQLEYMAIDAARHVTSIEDQKMSTSISSFGTAPSRLETARRFPGIDSRSLGIAAALAVGLAFTLCSLIVAVSPGTLARFASYALHLDITGLSRAITPASFLVGLGFVMLYAGAVVSATAGIYNRFTTNRSQPAA